MVSTTAIDCRYILSGCRDYASAQLLGGVFSPPYLCRCPILPLAIVSSVSDTCSPGLAFVVPLHVTTFGCHLYPSMIYVPLTLLSPHLDIHTLSTDILMTLRFSNDRTYLRLFPEVHPTYTGEFTATLCEPSLRCINKTKQFYDH